jgi:hypothetical protein
MKKVNKVPLFEYRIKYNVGMNHSALDSYHFYLAENADQAFEFHLSSMKHNHASAQNLSIEKWNPYSEKWEDESDHINIKEVDFSHGD